MGKKLTQLLWKWRGVAITAPGVTGLVIAIRLAGFLQLLEWAALDQFFRWRAAEPMDSRIVIVEIQESDIQQAGQWPISDAVLAELLNKIKQQQPRAIGLDIYRDLPVAPGHEQLKQVFESTPNLVGVQKVVGDGDGSVAPPPILSDRSQVGAVDILFDGDGKVRRSLISIRPKDQSTIYSLGAKLALIYLEAEGIQPENLPGSPPKVKLGQTIFQRLEKNDGGYINVNAGGYQILFNFRARHCGNQQQACPVFSTLSMSDVLADRMPPDFARDRIVLIGATAASLKDRFFTPYSTSYLNVPAGVELHAELTSQLISAALDDRPLIQVWSDPAEWMWIYLWSGVGATFAWIFVGRKWAVASIMVAGISLIGSAYLAFLAGWWIPLVPPLLALAGSAIALIGYIGYTERHRAEAKLRHNALHDALTGLPNRAYFLECLKQSIIRSKQDPKYLFAILFLDLDRFKLVNDALGHRTGDELLIAIARRLQNCLNSRDVVARLGGDEFIILLDHISSLDDATRTAEYIYEKLKAPFLLHGRQVFTSASIGIMLSTMDYHQPEEFLSAADVAMYRAKGEGRGCYQVFDRSMQAEVMKLLRLENDLRQAIERREFEVYYQPIVALKGDAVTGFEALVRWQHPEHGFVSPATFIPVAEESGLIVPLGWWILFTACQQLRAWQNRFPSNTALKLSVNLSGRQFLQTDLVTQIKWILQQTGLEPRSLKLEITETVVMKNAESAVAMLHELKELGITLSIDDFGTGYSSLSYLHRFPIDTLKIDRSFVSSMEQDEETLEIVRTIILLAHSLGMDVIAEGVETIEQLNLLKELGCEYVQGYLFSKPVTGALAESFIHEKKADNQLETTF